AQRRAQLDLDDARARLAELQKPPKAADVAQARASVTQAQAALDETRSTASAAKTKAELALKQAAQALPPIQSAYSQALLKWQEVKDNQDDPRWTGYRDTFLRAEADLHAAEDTMAQAQVEYDTARQNEGPTIRQAEANLADAQAKLDALNAG